MTNTVFVCADVFTYLHSTAEPAKRRRASEWLARLWHQSRGRTSAQELAEYYVFLTHQTVPVPAERAWKEVSALFAWQPQAVDEALMGCAYEAERSYGLQWRASLMVAAAQLQGCTVLLTEELPDGQAFGTLRVRDPFLQAVQQPAAVYAVSRQFAMA
jgi:predicted nucleic acid-binding protein